MLRQLEWKRGTGVHPTTTDLLAYPRVVNRRTPTRLRETGDPPARELRRQWRFRRADIDAWARRWTAAFESAHRRSVLGVPQVVLAQEMDWADRKAEEIVDRWYQEEGPADELSGATLANLIAEALREAARSAPGTRQGDAR